MIALVVAGGDTPRQHLRLPAVDLVVAADSGLDNAVALGVHVDVVVGDMDSVSSEALARAEADGVDVMRHPAAKDETDLALAMRLAIERGANRIIVAAASGGRLDHLLANIGLLASDQFADQQVELVGDDERLWVVRTPTAAVPTPTTIEVERGTTVTLLANGGDAIGVTTSGMRWELVDAVLEAGSTLGVSNIAEVDNPTVRVSGGVLLALAVVGV